MGRDPPRGAPSPRALGRPGTGASVSSPPHPPTCREPPPAASPPPASIRSTRAQGRPTLGRQHPDSGQGPAQDFAEAAWEVAGPFPESCRATCDSVGPLTRCQCRDRSDAGVKPADNRICRPWPRAANVESGPGAAERYGGASTPLQQRVWPTVAGVGSSYVAA